MSKNALRKNLASFLGSGGHRFDGSLFSTTTQPVPIGQGQQVEIEKLRAGKYQPRETITEDNETLMELEESIRSLGIIQPLVVRPLAGEGDEGCYEILAGERRFRAAIRAGLEKVPVVIRDVDDRIAVVITLVENLQRVDLNPMEQAHGIHRLMSEFELTQKEVAKLLGVRNQSTISRALGLLKLAPEVQAFIKEKKIDAGHAKTLLGMDPTTQVVLAEKAIQNDWSVRELECRKNHVLQPQNKTGEQRDPEIEELERQTSERLNGKKVRVRYNHTSGIGRIEIGFKGLEDCRSLLESLRPNGK